jgi:hypothetical protein
MCAARVLWCAAAVGLSCCYQNITLLKHWQPQKQKKEDVHNKKDAAVDALHDDDSDKKQL